MPSSNTKTRPEGKKMEPKRMIETPLLRFMRALRRAHPDGDLEEAFAKDAGTSKQYLYQVANNPQPNPSLRLALRLVEVSAQYGDEYNIKPLVLDDLLIGRVEISKLKGKGTDTSVRVLVDGKSYWRRIDKAERLVLVDKDETVWFVEETYPSDRRKSMIPALGSVIED